MAAEFLVKRYGISEETANELRFGYVQDPFPQHSGMVGRLCIPYLDAGGFPRALKFRCSELHSCKDAGCIKYLGEEGSEPRLYNPGALLDDDADTLYVTEGELDCAVLHQEGLTAVAYPGTGNWRPHFTRAIGPDWQRIVVVADGDDAGRGAAKKVAKELRGDVIECPQGHDISSLYAKGGRRGLVELLGLDEPEADDPFPF